MLLQSQSLQLLLFPNIQTVCYIAYNNDAVRLPVMPQPREN